MQPKIYDPVTRSASARPYAVAPGLWATKAGLLNGHAATADALGS